VNSEVTEILGSIQDSLIEGLTPSRDATRTGGLLTLFHKSSSLKYVNQTVPVGDVFRADLEELKQECASRDRSPFFEFHLELWPAVPPLLEEAGFVRLNTLPVMGIARADWGGYPSDIEVRDCTRDDLTNLHRVGALSFGGDPDEPEDQGLANAIEAGRMLACLAFCDGKPVGLGLAVGTKKIREIAGVGTLPEYRRRGVAAAVNARLADRFFALGGELAWLTPGNDEARRVYERVGFRHFATQVAYELPGQD